MTHLQKELDEFDMTVPRSIHERRTGVALLIKLESIELFQRTILSLGPGFECWRLSWPGA